MEDFKTGSIYLKLCYDFRAFIRCMTAAFYRPDIQEFLMCQLIERLVQAFVSKYAAVSLKHLVKLLKHSAKLLKHSAELLKV